MSAIFGLIRWDAQEVTARDFDPILPKLAPYGNGVIWAENQLGLGVCLSPLYPDKTHDEQVLIHDNLVLVADARLDNREALFQQLAIPPDETISDSRLILTAYQRWAEDCVSHLLGDFAFAIWDRQEQRLFAARDFIGARPFYYFQTQCCFGFASDLSAVLAFPDLEVAIDEDELFQTILRQPHFYSNPAKTLYKNVYRLAFAHQMTVQAGEIRLRQHWTGLGLPQVRYSRDEDYFEHTLELLQKALASRIRGLGKIGAHISGGLDSSSVAMTAAGIQKAEGREIALFSWSPPSMDSRTLSSETYRIEAITRQLGLKPEYVPFMPSNLEDMLSPKNRRMRVEEAVMQAAQAKGLGLMLSGWGGDEFISLGGRGYQAELFAKGQWRELYLSLQPFALELDWFKHLLSRLWHFISLPLMPDALFPYFRHTEKSYAKPLDDSCFEPSFLQRLKAAQTEYQPERVVIRGRRENQVKLFEQGHLTNRIELWAAAGARHQLVYAYPLLDRRMVEFALSVPDRLYLQRGQARYLFRQATASLFPPELRDFNAPKTEPEKILHGHIVEQMLSKYYQQAAVIDEAIPWIDKECLEARLKRVTSVEEWQSLRAALLLNFWRDLKKEMGS